jgi:hypothetical protein
MGSWPIRLKLAGAVGSGPALRLLAPILGVRRPSSLLVFFRFLRRFPVWRPPRPVTGDCPAQRGCARALARSPHRPEGSSRKKTKRDEKRRDGKFCCCGSPFVFLGVEPSYANAHLGSASEAFAAAASAGLRGYLSVGSAAAAASANAARFEPGEIQASRVERRARDERSEDQ